MVMQEEDYPKVLSLKKNDEHESKRYLVIGHAGREFDTNVISPNEIVDCAIVQT